MAEKSLGGDVQSNWLDYRVRKDPCKRTGSDLFMTGIDAGKCNIFAKVVQEVSIVMEKAGDDQLRTLSMVFSQISTLQGMLLFGH